MIVCCGPKAAQKAINGALIQSSIRPVPFQFWSIPFLIRIPEPNEEFKSIYHLFPFVSIFISTKITLSRNIENYFRFSFRALSLLSFRSIKVGCVLSLVLTFRNTICFAGLLHFMFRKWPVTCCVTCHI